MASNVKPLYIQVDPQDNVAIVNPDGSAAGTQFADGLTLKDIPQAHKVALRSLQRGDPVRRCGQIIIEEIGWEIFHFILDVASGRKKTWADHRGLHDALVLFNPGPIP